MRLGGNIFAAFDNPQQWVSSVRAKGYRAAYCPLPIGADSSAIAAYRRAAEDADIVIAEVGAWSNPMSLDATTRVEALEKCKRGLELAEQIGAVCCVNVAGSRGPSWDGPDPADLTAATFDALVDTVREIIDDVGPLHSAYALETMPWLYPDSAESALRLVKAVERVAFAIHFDPVNLVSSPQRYFGNAGLIREFVAIVGPYIRCCHVKDVKLDYRLTVHLDEVRPGLGGLDHAVLLGELDRLGPNLPVMLEHLPDEEEYAAAAAYVRQVAAAVGVQL